ncbi:hypothetical protein GCM10027598_80620 [Amycolatopsis oliviviridis]|uniref:Uncharacterized protein n=1 Tax=Amycolatopsis oliviviridis TaxID=1471590 RepID=A0ABQ3L6R8_9PSEU|nr:hypothetical protein [Amycolatopsis oliviviridis]GHH05916.1 hypothetical protein GCM10017790_10530 [Amycolatopsis oliviviridis]
MDDFGDDPDDLAKWGLHCFCLGARSTPHHVVKMDDNGRLLFRARLGVSRAELWEQGIDPLDSQIALLRAYDLVSVEGDRLMTTFPVLGSEETAALRARMAGLAEAIVPAIEAEVSTLAGVLADQGLAHCAYGVFFGYVIDGLVWDRLMEEGLLPVTKLSVERPYWNGAFWAVYPPRAGAMGTNEVREAGVRLTMVWTDSTVNALNRLADDPALWSALRVVSHGDLPRESLWSDDRGRSRIPIIRRQDGDPVHEIGLRIAAEVVSALLRNLPEAGVVVAAHELIWNLMDALEATGVVRRPSSFDDPEAAPESLRAQTFLSVGD